MLKVNEDEIDYSNIKVNKNDTTQSNLNVSGSTKLMNEDLKKKVAEQKFVEKALKSQREILSKND